MQLRHTKLAFVLSVVMLAISSFCFAQESIKLYPTKAPGSESWNWQEKSGYSNVFKTELVYNVTEPTLLVYPAPKNIATGTSVIIAPGGGFQTLSINSEGIDVAKWLNGKGVTCFVLKYRLAKSNTDDPATELMAKMADPKKFEAENAPVIPLATNDGLTAVKYVRSHAATYGLNPDKIGFMGFSAGGTVTMSVVYHADADSRPNFIAPIYAFAPEVLAGSVPSQITPAFIVAASNDQLMLTSHSTSIYQKWFEAKQPAELHIYEKGGHGFGMHKQYLTSDKWIERFGEWLGQRGLLRPLKEDEWSAKLTPEKLEEIKQNQENQIHLDWANFARFAAENKALSAPLKNEKRVVFMGNSITEGWINMDPDFFRGKPYIDRGISGQTTPQMLVRFKQDVVDLKPAVVVILAGTNDVAGNTGPTTPEIIQEHLISMAELAKANGIKVVMSSIIPVYDYPWKPGLKPAETIVSINQFIKSWSEKNGVVYLDYFTSMADERNGLQASLTYDGVHPNLAGYKVMEALAEKAIAQALKLK
ncbi:MAG: alpha/beta hydrolase fold domain-containing protein [Chitinophagaceae bacterium]|nr:alpha/beta hydrolase fold domain-containing protein [Chitinophagaceae bacterium]